MAYTPRTYIDGEQVGADDFNRIETGIDAVHAIVDALPDSPTPAEVNDAIEAALGALTASDVGAATAADITAAINGLVAGAPGALDTLNEIAAALAADDTDIAALFTAIGAKYTKPGTGIPKTDLATGVQTSLDKADGAASATALGNEVARAMAAEQANAANVAKKADLIASPTRPTIVSTGTSQNTGTFGTPVRYSDVQRHVVRLQNRSAVPIQVAYAAINTLNPPNWGTAVTVGVGQEFYDFGNCAPLWFRDSGGTAVTVAHSIEHGGL